MADSQAKEQNLLFCKIVATLLIADAAITDDERDFLHRLMDRFEFDDTDRQAVYNAVDIGTPVDDWVGQLDAGPRAQLLGELEAAAAIDGDLAAGERQVIEDVRKALG